MILLVAIAVEVELNQEVDDRVGGNHSKNVQIFLFLNENLLFFRILLV
jgi:hypothetical protein